MDPVNPNDRNDPEDETTPPEDAEKDGLQDGAEAEFAAAGFERWRRESAFGSVGTGIARGLQNVFAPPANQPVIVAAVPGDPPDPDRIQVILDPDDPTKSIVVVPRAGAAEPTADTADPVDPAEPDHSA